MNNQTNKPLYKNRGSDFDYWRTQYINRNYTHKAHSYWLSTYGKSIRYYRPKKSWF